MKIEDIGRIIEGKYHLEKPRAYLGVSAIGTPCRRALWYDFRMFTKPEAITARKQRLFTRGHYEELILYKDIIQATKSVIKYIEIGEAVQEIFNTVFNHQLPERSQKKLTFCSGHGSGHSDGVLVLATKKGKDKKYLLECKTSNVKGFMDLKRDLNLLRSKPEHYAQIQGYLHLLQLKKALYVMVNKETDERLFIVVKYDPDFAADLFTVAEKIILSNSPPPMIEGGSPDFYMCRPYTCKITGKEELYCPHRQVCHFSARPQLTCRSCKMVEIHDKGRWFCSRKKAFRTFDEQLQGCKKYEALKY